MSWRISKSIHLSEITTLYVNYTDKCLEVLRSYLVLERYPVSKLIKGAMVDKRDFATLLYKSCLELLKYEFGSYAVAILNNALLEDMAISEVLTNQTLIEQIFGLSTEEPGATQDE